MKCTIWTGDLINSFTQLKTKFTSAMCTYPEIYIVNCKNLNFVVTFVCFSFTDASRILGEGSLNGVLLK